MAGGWKEMILVLSSPHHSRILWNEGSFPPAAPRTVRDSFPEAPSSGPSPPLTLLFNFSVFLLQLCVSGEKKSPAVCKGQRSLICAELKVLLKLITACLALSRIIITWIHWSSSTFFPLSWQHSPTQLQTSCYSCTCGLPLCGVSNTPWSIHTPTGFITAQH